MIDAGRAEETDPIAAPHQSNALARNSESDADLWAGRHEADVGSQLLEQEGVALVAAVVADLLTQQAGGHADQDLAHVAPSPGRPTSASSAAHARGSCRASCDGARPRSSTLTRRLGAPRERS